MRVEQLNSLIEVVKAGSINAATEKLHITQQSLNKSLKSLENELGCKLLDRTKKGITLTASGEVVLSASQDIVQRINRLQEDLTEANVPHSHLSGNLNINISPMISISVLPFAFIEFLRRYPNVNVYTIEKYRDEIISRTANQTNELGLLCVSNLIPNFKETIPDDVELIILKQYPIYIAVSPRHPLAHHKYLSIKTISAYPVIVYEAGGVKGIHAFQHSEQMKVALSTNNPRLCEERLRSGDAIMYSFPPYLERNVFASFVHIPISDRNCNFIIYFAINKNVSRAQRNVAEAFVNVFREYL